MSTGWISGTRDIAAVQRRQGQWAEATVNCERALAINPHNRSNSETWVARLLAQRYYVRAEQAAEARRFADRAWELMPVKRNAVGGPLALGDFAQVHLALGDRDRTLALLDQALSVPS
ncbi:MAG: hypothetical protein RL077_6405 [Verrucomicrobiota bacterium]|jgi:tetratricopeptide (TPR) repeat protein